MSYQWLYDCNLKKNKYVKVPERFSAGAFQRQKQSPKGVI